MPKFLIPTFFMVDADTLEQAEDEVIALSSIAEQHSKPLPFFDTKFPTRLLVDCHDEDTVGSMIDGMSMRDILECIGG